MPVPQSRAIRLAIVATLAALSLTACASDASPIASMRAEAAPSTQGEASAQLTERSPTSSLPNAASAPTDAADFPAVTAGDCLQDAVPPAQGYASVPCSAAHNYEVFASKTLTESAFPGETELDLIAAELCERGYADYVGGNSTNTQLSVGIFAPSEQEWLFGDRELLCVLVSPEAQGNSGSLRDSGR